MKVALDKEAFSRQYIDALVSVLQNLPLDDWARVLQLLERAFVERRQVFIVGNGGSAATASHMANDLMLGVAKEGGRGFRAIALTDSVPLMTAIANDTGYDNVFTAQLRALGRPGDVLIAISGSGKSPNVVEAVKVAREIGIMTVGFLGMGGGQLRELVDAAIVVPSNDYGLIEDIHLMLDHLMTAYFRHWQQVE